MPSMTDPMNALVQFQDAFEAGMIPVQSGRLDPDLLFAPDTPNGRPRFNYMRVEGDLLIALVMFAQIGLEDGYPVFNIGYAVLETHRGRGLAKSTLVSALAELSAGLAGARIPVLHVEAVISRRSRRSRTDWRLQASGKAGNRMGLNAASKSPSPLA